MSKQKKQAEQPKLKPEVIQSIEDRELPGLTIGYKANIAQINGVPIDTILETTDDPIEDLKLLLKAIYRSGATGTPRNLSKDLETITKLIQGDTDV